MAYIFPSKDGPVLLNDNTSIKLISATQKSSTVPLSLFVVIIPLESFSVESPSDLTIPSKSDTSVLSEDDQAANDAQEVKEVVEEVFGFDSHLHY